MLNDVAASVWLKLHASSLSIIVRRSKSATISNSEASVAT